MGRGCGWYTRAGKYARSPGPGTRDPGSGTRDSECGCSFVRLPVPPGTMPLPPPQEPVLDPISQLALGASVAAVAVPRTHLRRALVYGAALGSLPDLDYVFLTRVDDLARFTLHRSFSHSLFVLTALAPLLAWVFRRMDAGLRVLPWWRWLLAVWLTLATHPLLDAFTVYGTQLWWPLQPPPASWATIAIIDPAYTLPLLVAVACAAFSRRVPAARRALAIGLCLSSAYLAWSVAAKAWVGRQAAPAIAATGLDPERVLVSPSLLTTLVWRVLVMTPDGYSEGWYSLLAHEPQLQFEHGHSDVALRRALADLPSMQRLEWFSHGYLSVRIDESGRVLATDLRMGAEPDYVFTFALARRESGAWQPIRPTRIDSAPDWRGRGAELWRRLRVQER
ncbi:MAG TPA: metal-dependent hydrolase [Xanthomonadaceae bacterium]|nr:metal-dependent hydrolase [Xanthomonadaceae bacterium]